ncbi:MAG: helix-turn-helix transcriptional regulator [Pseudomonadales bacterium]|nr:helix-turn-helix transcriptional regulator [Pseudomonadales bacterium]
MTKPARSGLLVSSRADLLDTLYEAPCNAEAWAQFLEKLVSATQSRSARMLVMDRHAETVLSSLKHNIDDSAHQQYVTHYVNACPWRPELKHKLPGHLYSTFLDFSCQQAAFYRTEFYNDWARQQDIHHGVCGTVWQDEDYTVQLLIQRTGGQGHYSREETADINDLISHVRRAIRLQTQISAMEHQRQGLQDTLNIQAQPFLLLTGQGRIVHLTDDARLLLEQHPLATLQRGQLCLLDPRLQGQLITLLRQVTLPNTALVGAGGVISLPGDHSPPLRCLISPLRHEHSRHSLWSHYQEPLAILYLHDLTTDVLIDQDSLMQLFELSEAEARVATDISRGLSPQQIAARHNLSVHTVRTQLKAVFQKTGTSRQSELAKLVLTAPLTKRWRRPPLSLKTSA